MKHLWLLGCDQKFDLIEHQSHFSFPFHEYHCHWTKMMIHQKNLIFSLNFIALLDVGLTVYTTFAFMLKYIRSSHSSFDIIFGFRSSTFIDEFDLDLIEVSLLFVFLKLYIIRIFSGLTYIDTPNYSSLAIIRNPLYFLKI